LRNGKTNVLVADSWYRYRDFPRRPSQNQEMGKTYFSRSTKVMFSAISATRFAILEAMMV
jgi:hypothetical protein